LADEWIAETAERNDINAMSWQRSLSTWALLAQDAPAVAAPRLREAEQVERSSNDVFAAVALLQATAIRVYEDAAAGWSWIAQDARPRFERIIASLVPLTTGLFALLSG